jgi:hypothetical protein
MIPMSTTLTILLGLALAAVVAVLFTGVFSFARGGEFHRRNATRLMNLRVAAQAFALLIFVILLLLGP